MKKIVGLLLSGLAIMFVRIDINGPPAPAASAGEVLFTEGDPIAALRGGGVKDDRDPYIIGGEKPEEPKEIAQATPDVPIDVKELQRAADAIQAQAAPEIAAYAYKVRARGSMLVEVNGVRQWITPETFPSCTAVSIGGGRFITAGHLTKGLGGKIEVDVLVGDEWVNNAQQTSVPGRDLLLLKVDRDVPGVTVRKPEYFEHVTLYGLTTKELQGGIFAGDNRVAVQPDQSGVTFGDSGGGVFGPDGELVGVIQGYGKDGPRSVYVVTLEDLPSAADVPKAAAPKASQGGQSCPGGVCPAPQTQPRGFVQPRRGRRH